MLFSSLVCIYITVFETHIVIQWRTLEHRIKLTLAQHLDRLAEAEL